MNARVPPAKMEAHAQTMLTPTPAPVGLALPVSTAKPTYLIVQKGVCVCVCVYVSVMEISHVLLNLFIHPWIELLNVTLKFQHFVSCQQLLL